MEDFKIVRGEKHMKIDLLLRYRRPWWNIFRQLFFVAALIGPGIALDSSAMQWLGFLLLIIVVLSVAFSEAMKNTGLTPEQAVKRIAELDAKAKGKSREFVRAASPSINDFEDAIRRESGDE